MIELHKYIFQIVCALLSDKMQRLSNEYFLEYKTILLGLWEETQTMFRIRYVIPGRNRESYVFMNQYRFANRIWPACIVAKTVHKRREDNRTMGNKSNRQIIVLSGLAGNEKLGYLLEWERWNSVQGNLRSFRKR